jgi:rod shape-determining protein MreD
MALKIADASGASQVDKVVARLLPVATTAVAAILSIEPIHIAGYADLAPDFTLMVVYHWTIYRPDLLPALAIFLIGVIYDLLTGGPPGASALLLLLARAVVLRHRRWFLHRTFLSVWAGFILLTVAAMLGLWILHSLLEAEMSEFQTAIFRGMLTMSLFPVVSFLLGRAQQALMGAG